MPYKKTARVEVVLDADILDAAIAGGVDIGYAAEAAIIRALPVTSAVKAERVRLWQTENAEAIECLNRYAEAHGLTFPQYRRYPWPSSTPT